MASTFSSIYVSYRAMVAAQAGTSVVGNNISNMNTEGYTRQRADLAAQTLSGYKSRFDTSLIHTGNGVAATGTSQIRDPFLDARYRTEHANQGRYNAISEGITDIENILDEISTKGLQSEFDNFVNQLQNLSQYPTSKDIGLVVRTSAQQLTQMLNIYSTQLDQVRSQQVFDLSSVTIDTEFNSVVESIANLNGQIREEYIYGNTPNELLDQRNSLIDQLSQMANIKVTVTADEVADGLFLEHLSISMFDEATATQIGLVDHTKANLLSVKDDGNEVKIEMQTSFKHPNTPLTVDYDDITSFFQTGSISGYLDLINGRGDYANTVDGENNFRGVLYYKDMLNTFAKNFANAYNEINSIQTTNPDAISILTSNVAAKALDNNDSTNFIKDYLAVYDKFTFKDSADAKVEMTTITAANDLSASGVEKILIDAKDEDAKAFIKKYFDPAQYTANPDGSIEITDPAALAALTPTKLLDADREKVLDAFPATYDQDGTTITSMLIESKPLFEPYDGSEFITAGNISISEKWIDDPLFITTTKDATKANGLSKQPGGTDNVLRMISAVSNDISFLQEPSNSESSLKFTGTFNEYLVSIGGTLALDVELNGNYLDTSNTLLSSLFNARESVSGVSLDEEATHLMTFQSAYNAAARYFTALDEMLDKLINGTGLVGR